MRYGGVFAKKPNSQTMRYGGVSAKKPISQHNCMNQNSVATDKYKHPNWRIISIVITVTITSIHTTMRLTINS